MALVMSFPGMARADSSLRYSPPSLVQPTTVKVTAANAALKLDSSKDYVVQLPAAPLQAPGGVVISGGHNVVLIGGTISVPSGLTGPAGKARRGLYLNGQTGTVHVEGLRLTGDLAEGIDLNQPYGSTVQLQNIRIDSLRAADEVKFTDTHPDLIQSWAGPKVLRVDRFTGYTDYQGFFLDPNQYGTQDAPTDFSFSNVDIHGDETAAYLFWLGRRCEGTVERCAALSRVPVSLENVTAVSPRNPASKPPWAAWEDSRPFIPGLTTAARLSVQESRWAGVRFQDSAAENVRRDVAGVGYQSPGYGPASLEAGANEARTTVPAGPVTVALIPGGDVSASATVPAKPAPVLPLSSPGSERKPSAPAGTSTAVVTRPIQLAAKDKVDIYVERRTCRRKQSCRWRTVKIRRGISSAQAVQAVRIARRSRKGKQPRVRVRVVGQKRSSTLAVAILG